MTKLVITDIRKSSTIDDFDLLTAIILNAESHDEHHIISPGKKNHNGLLVLESAIAKQAYPDIGVRRGDQFLRIRANPDHGLKVGEELRFEG